MKFLQKSSQFIFKMSNKLYFNYEDFPLQLFKHIDNSNVLVFKNKLNDEVYYGFNFKLIQGYNIRFDKNWNLVINDNDFKDYSHNIYIIGYRCTLGGRTFDQDNHRRYGMMKQTLDDLLKDSSINVVECLLYNVKQKLDFIDYNPNDIYILIDFKYLNKFNNVTEISELTQYCSNIDHICYMHVLNPKYYPELCKKLLEVIRPLLNKPSVPHRCMNNIALKRLVYSWASKYFKLRPLQELFYDSPLKPINGFIEMNCNPMHIGHVHLIKTALKVLNKVSPNGKLIIAVVETDTEADPILLKKFHGRNPLRFENRFKIVTETCKKISKDIIVVPNGKLLIGNFFTGYTNINKKVQNCYQGGTDAMRLFAKIICPMLDIGYRFFGTEPNDVTTNQYNEDAKIICPKEGIKVFIINRLRVSF